MANEFSSGGGKDSPVPDIVKNHFNWGVFFLALFWPLGNNSYIPLIVIAVFVSISLIPFLGGVIVLLASLPVYIWMGIKGNEWAWQNKNWASVEEFHRVQKLWAIWGVIINFVVAPIIILVLVFSIGAAFIGVLGGSGVLNMQKSDNLSITPCVIEAGKINAALDGKNIMSTANFVEAFSDLYPGSTTTLSSVTTTMGQTYRFFANGACDVEMQNCGIAVEKNGKRICRYHVGQSTVVEVK